MFKYIILFLCVSVSGVLCDLNKEEGADCEWEELKGKCVKETRCFTTLEERSPKHPVCSEKDGETIICCTDCELVDDTKNAVLSPTGGIFWKNGRKARDQCLQYLKDLPYQCKRDGYYGGITRELDGDKKCSTYKWWAIGGPPDKDGPPPGAKYPHQVLLGYGADHETAKWTAGGFIISDKYIVTAAHATRNPDGEVKFLAMEVKNRSDAPESWRIQKIKRIIVHPEYKTPNKYHDIALIETDTPIKFDNNVLPACLHVEEGVSDEHPVTTTWLSLETDTSRDAQSDTIQTINLEKFTEEECKTAYVPSRLLKQGYDHATQMCYGSKTDSTQTHETCKGLSGEPLLVDTQFSWCVYTAIGITSFGRACGSKNPSADVYTRISHYVPWIESIVWP